jgi:hypothetical protein
MFPSDPASLYMVDAGLNALVRIDSQSGWSRVVTHFPNVANIGAGPCDIGSRAR